MLSFKKILLNNWFLTITFPLILMVLTAFFTPLGQIIFDYFKSGNPSFVIVNFITRPDSLIIIEARNEAAEKEDNLDVDFDGLKLKDAAIPVKNSDPQRWKINIAFLVDKRYLVDGMHTIKLAFKGKPFSEELKIIFNTQAPIVNVKIQKNIADSSGQIIKGIATTKLQIPGDTLKVDVFYIINGKTEKINIPVKRVVEQETGAFYFEFETSVQGLPGIDSKDPGFSKPFFGFQVSDQAGNKYYQIQSYAEYMAPGDKVFGVNVADIKVQKLQIEGKTQTIVFKVTPQPVTKQLNDDGTPAIILKVTHTAANYRDLVWETNVKDVQPLTLIYKNDKNIGTSFSNKFRDKSVSKNDNAKYRVEKKSISGDIIYTSSEAENDPFDYQEPDTVNTSDIEIEDSLWFKRDKVINVSLKFRQLDSIPDSLIVIHAEIISIKYIAYQITEDCYKIQTPYLSIYTHPIIEIKLTLMNTGGNNLFDVKINSDDDKDDYVFFNYQYNTDRLTHNSIFIFSIELPHHDVSGRHRIVFERRGKDLYTLLFNICK